MNECSIPCWIHITPGVTSVDVAKDQIDRLLIAGGYTFQKVTSGDKSTFFSWTKFDSSNSVTSSINLTINNEIVTSINIGTDFVDASLPNLGDIISTIGPPTCVFEDDRLHWSTLIYENGAGQSVLEIELDRLSWVRPVRNITLDSQSALNCRTLMAPPWRGLAKAERYLP